ncbi:hypothetical protein [Jannaschia sp. CCS1]|uniref:hypothetical protein n=1 Tax=Jannaschia sp. (strain CCS1) TaxID=290400 RepID=UPI000053D077|nr:hypothetical protein [Jannaschia sp. CCS1]
MLELDTNLPRGTLCAAHPSAVSSDLTGALWWHGSAAQMEQDPNTGAVSRWQAFDGGPPALPTEPNSGNGQIGQVDDLFGLQCRAGTHCGVVAQDVAPDAATATIAVRFYTPPGEDARTLFALNAPGAGNYVFLSEAGGVLTAKDDQGRAEVTLPCTDIDAPHLAIVSLHGDRLALALGRERVDMHARDLILTGSASLFIGCRNQRPRLLKTLGAALILDVWLFPGRALLHEDTEQEAKALTALNRHHLWAAA